MTDRKWTIWIHSQRRRPFSFLARNVPVVVVPLINYQVLDGLIRSVSEKSTTLKVHVLYPTKIASARLARHLGWDNISDHVVQARFFFNK
jgi:hypothetical protein